MEVRGAVYVMPCVLMYVMLWMRMFDAVGDAVSQDAAVCAFKTWVLELGWSEPRAVRAIASHPALLAFSVTSKSNPHVAWLHTGVGRTKHPIQE